MRKHIDKITSYLKIEKLKNDTRVVVFLICLFIASALWFLNALSKDYTTTISYPVKYVSAPSHHFLANTPPSKLELKVDAHGFTLLRHKLSLSSAPIILNLSNITRNLAPIDGTYLVQTAGIMRRVSSQVTNEISIREILPEIIPVVLDSLKTKVIPVRTNINIEFKPQFNLKSPISVQPDKVSITGPAAIIDTLQFLLTEEKTYKEVDREMEKRIDINHPEQTTIVPQEVTLKIDVEKFTEKQIEVPIQVMNEPDNVKVKLFPSAIKINCMVGLSVFEELNPNDFRVVVDFQEIKPDIKNLPVVLESSPAFVEIIRFAPESVEYLIETN